MKKVFIGFLTGCLLFVGAPVFANHISMPNLPIGETAYNITEDNFSCGKRVVYFFGDGYAVVTLNGKGLAITSKHGFYVWLDRDQDGHIDEYWEQNDIGAFVLKYPTFCDLVQK